MATLRLRGRNQQAKETLPPACMSCGEPTDYYKEKRFTWHPPWINVLILAGWLPYLIIVLVLRKHMTVRLPLCETHRAHWFWYNVSQIVVLVAFFVSMIGLGVLAGVLENRNMGGFICAAFALFGVVFLALAIALYVWSRQLVRPEEITDTSITLAAVSDEFLDEYYAGDEEEPPPPPKKRKRDGSRSDAIERYDD
jgi:hypothetical protein